VLAFALAVRLAIAPFHGFFHDLQAYVTWGRIFDHDPLHFYTAASTPTVMRAYHIAYLPNYPPLTIYLFGLLDAVYYVIARLFTTQPSFDVAHTPLLAVYGRLPVLAADLATVALIYQLARRWRSHRFALLAAASYALSPLVLFDGALWGQTDALFLLMVMLALLCALRGSGIRAGILVGVAVLLKPQPIIFAPLVAFYLWRTTGPREAARTLGAMLCTVLVFCVPFLLPSHPQMLAFADALRFSFASAPFSSLDAFNLWWLLLIPHHVYTAPLVGPLSANVLGDLFFASVFVIACVGLWRDPSARRLFLAAALLAVAFFMLTTLQHQRYLFPAAGLLLLASVEDWRVLPLYVVSCLTALLNMTLAIIYDSNPLSVAPSDPGIDVRGAQALLLQHGEVTVLIAAINAWLLVMICIIYLRSLSARPLQAPAATHANTEPAAQAPDILELEPARVAEPIRLVH
jgi:Gpi18-like mannosyltransferase